MTHEAIALKIASFLATNGHIQGTSRESPLTHRILEEIGELHTAELTLRHWVVTDIIVGLGDLADRQAIIQRLHVGTGVSAHELEAFIIAFLPTVIPLVLAKRAKRVAPAPTPRPSSS